MVVAGTTFLLLVTPLLLDKLLFLFFDNYLLGISQLSSSSCFNSKMWFYPDNFFDGKNLLWLLPDGEFLTLISSFPVEFPKSISSKTFASIILITGLSYSNPDMVLKVLVSFKSGLLIDLTLNRLLPSLSAQPTLWILFPRDDSYS